MPRNSGRGSGGRRARGTKPILPQSGVGNPHEVPWFYTQSRDPGQAQPPPPDVVYEPGKDPKNHPINKADADRIQRFTGFFLASMRKNAVFVQQPAFQQPPYFAQPKIIISKTVVTAGNTFILIAHDVAARYRSLIVCSGLGVDTPAALQAGTLRFNFQISGGQRIDYLEHQVGGVNSVTKPFGFGISCQLPGTLCEPFCYLSNGLQFEVAGPQQLQLVAQNTGAASVEVCVLLGLYKYWTPNAAEHQQASLQE